MSTLHLTAVLRKENPLYTCWCPEIDITSQGKTQESALKNLKEAIDLCLEDDEIHEEIIKRAEQYQRDSAKVVCFDIEASI